MFLRRFTDFILRSPLNAIGIALVTAFIPLINSFSILIAGLVALCKDALTSFLVTIAASLPLIVAWIYYPNSHTLMSGLILLNLLTWLFAVLLRKFGSWNIVIEVAIIIGLLIVCVVHWMIPNVQDWWVPHLSNYYKQANSTMNQSGADLLTLPSDQMTSVIATMKNFMTGVLVFLSLFIVITQVILARWWQALVFNPGGLQPELRQIRFSYAMGAIFLIALIGSYINSPVALDCMPVLIGAFCMAGLSLIHCLLAKNKFAWLWLLVIYLGIIFLYPVVIVIAIFALFDIALDFRKRFNKVKQT